MRSRLFHTIVVYGAGLAMLPLACSADTEPSSHASEPDAAGRGDAGVPALDDDIATRCKLAQGGCNEHCSPLGDGGCLDPCFVHTISCSPDCLRLDGSCGWPPTK